MRLAINLVTRGRPYLLARTIEHTVANIAEPSTCFMISVDDDDGPTIDVLKSRFAAITDVFDGANVRGHIQVSIRPREDSLGEKYNRITTGWDRREADVYCNLSDHGFFATPGFDRKILDTAALFPDGIGIVVNHLCNASFSNEYAVTKKLVDKLGFYAPPLFPYWFWDHWLDDIGKMIGRTILAEVKVDYHPSGKPMTQGIREPAWWGTFFDAAYMARRKVAHAIVDGEDFQEPAWRKAATKANAPLIEYRSKWINDHLRQNNRELIMRSNAGAPDERYLRLKEKALRLLPGYLELLPKDEAKAYAAALLPASNVVNLPKAYVR
jgi:hypothetical protein